MVDNILSFLQMLPPELKAMIISAIPIIEVRGAIPIGLSFGMAPFYTLVLCYIGSMIPVPFILLGIRPVFNALGKVKWIGKILDHLSTRSMKKSKNIQAYGFAGLVLFVAIPLPGTGVWSGAMAASLLNMRIKSSLLAIAIGNLVAGTMITLISTGVFKILGL